MLRKFKFTTECSDTVYDATVIGDVVIVTWTDADGNAGRSDFDAHEMHSATVAGHWIIVEDDPAPPALPAVFAYKHKMAGDYIYFARVIGDEVFTYWGKDAHGTMKSMDCLFLRILTLPSGSSKKATGFPVPSDTLPHKFHFRQWNMKRVVYTAVVMGDDVYVSWDDTPWTHKGGEMYKLPMVEDFLASNIWECVD